MPASSSQIFLRELDKKLWTAADKLRSNLDAAVYKHAVLRLIFLKYVSDSFAQRQAEIEAMLKEPENDFFVEPDGYDKPAQYDEAIHRELEERDYYMEKNVFWVPALARWKTLQDSAKLPSGTEITVKNGKTTKYKITSLGHVYEYFLGQFTLAEGKKGGQYFTPKSIVSLIVEMIEPYQGRVYDPAMGSGGFFVRNTRPSGVCFAKRCGGSARGVVQSERFIEEHGGTIRDIMVFGQDQWAWGAHLRRAQRARKVRLRRKQPNRSNPTTWRLAAMNMAIRSIEFDFGKEPADTFTRDQHPDLRADFVMANPPFNIKEWSDGKLEGDARWKYGTPPQGNANFAWVQHMLHHLAPNGSMALLLANGSMSSNSSGEGDIRRALIEADLVECVVALPGQLFTNTQIPALHLVPHEKQNQVLPSRCRRPARPPRRDAIHRRPQAWLHERPRAAAAAKAAEWRNYPIDNLIHHAKAN